MTEPQPTILLIEDEPQMRRFLRASLTSNISGLNRISKTLVKQRDALDKTLTYAPDALNNLYLAGNVRNGTLDTRDNAGDILDELQSDPAAVLCTRSRLALKPTSLATVSNRPVRP